MGFTALEHKKDGWMACGFVPFSTVFQSYKADGWVIMKGYGQWNPVYVRKTPRVKHG